jgi:hypothetical protein
VVTDNQIAADLQVLGLDGRKTMTVFCSEMGDSVVVWMIVNFW